MKHALAAMIATVALAAAPARAAVLDLGGYQGNDGAITIGNGGKLSDPYFATKALLLAREGGIDVKSAAGDWIHFALSKQRPDGLFDRYCLADDGSWAWNACAVTDADDAALALWLELLHIMKPYRQWPTAWKDSAERAEFQLQSLLDRQTGLYHISASLPVSLLMDNVEIYHAFQIISRQSFRGGDVVRGTEYRKKARDLSKAIHATLWDEARGRWLVSTQARTEEAFYPDHVAQVYPMFYNLPLPDGQPRQRAFRAWLGEHREAWLNDEKDYPWGLVAVAAADLGAKAEAACWQVKAEHLRYGPNWNVLEEASLQRVHAELPAPRTGEAPPCTEVPHG